MEAKVRCINQILIKYYHTWCINYENLSLIRLDYLLFSFNSLLDHEVPSLPITDRLWPSFSITCVFNLHIYMNHLFLRINYFSSKSLHLVWGLLWGVLPVYFFLLLVWLFFNLRIIHTHSQTILVSCFCYLVWFRFSYILPRSVFFLVLSFL